MEIKQEYLNKEVKIEIWDHSFVRGILKESNKDWTRIFIPGTSSNFSIHTRAIYKIAGPGEEMKLPEGQCWQTGNQ